MNLIEFMKMQIHFEDKPSNYIERFVIAYLNEMKIEDLDLLSEDEYTKLANKAQQIYFYDDKDIKKEFKHNGIEYKLKDVKEITAEDWINFESILEKADKTPKTFPAILCILTNTDEQKAFHTLDHKIAMPIISFFLSLHQELDSNLVRFTKMLLESRKINLFTIQQEQDLINVIRDCFNFYFLWPRKDQVN